MAERLSRTADKEIARTTSELAAGCGRGWVRKARGLAPYPYRMLIADIPTADIIIKEGSAHKQLIAG